MRLQWLAIGTGGLIGIALAIPLFFNQPAESGDLRLSDLDFGSVFESAAYPHTVTVSNNSSNDLEVTRFVSSCSCANVQPDHFHLRSGESREVTVMLNLSQKPGRKTDGRRMFAATIMPVVKGFEPTTWALTGVIEPFPLKVDPPFVRWSETCSPGQEKEVLVTAKDESVTGLGVNESGFFDVSVKTIREGTWALTVQPKKDRPVGPFADHLKLSVTSNSANPVGQLDIPLLGYYSRLAYPSPQSITFGFVKQGIPNRKSLTINLNEDDVQVLGIQSDSTAVQASFSKSGDRQYHVVVECLSQVIGSQSTVLSVVLVSNGEKETLVVPVFFNSLENYPPVSVSTSVTGNMDRNNDEKN